MPSSQPAANPAAAVSRRTFLRGTTAALAGGAGCAVPRSATASAAEPAELEPRPWVSTRAIYGGFPQAIFDRGQTPADYGLNAIWVGSGSLERDQIKRYQDLGMKVYAEFNSMHEAQYLKQHPDAAPIGADGKPSPPPAGWQGISPFHAGYRRNRMDEFRRVLETFPIDGIWLDYHHAHASWERDQPIMPDTDFCAVALQQFQQRFDVTLPSDVPAAAQSLLTQYRDQWTQFRCDVFTDWVREYREILDQTRPEALLGTFHCPWSQSDYDGAIRHKLAIDLPAQYPYLDIFSIMPYHARFGYSQDPSWISRQTAALGQLLGIRGTAEESKRIWPIVQMADWGETVSAADATAVIDHGTRLPATGVMTFHWNGLSQQWDKMEAIAKVYRTIR